MKKVFKIELTINLDEDLKESYNGDLLAKSGLCDLLMNNLPESCAPQIKIEVKNYEGNDKRTMSQI